MLMNPELSHSQMSAKTSPAAHLGQPSQVASAALNQAYAARLAQHIVGASRPRQPDLHLIEGAHGALLLVVNASQLFHLPLELVPEFRQALQHSDASLAQQLLREYDLHAAPRIDDTPLQAPPVHALSLAIAQKCNLGCSYCYAQQGEFGGKAKNMSLELAKQAVDLLVREASPGSKINLAFMGGEPLSNRAVLRQVTQYAATQAQTREIDCRFSITTNGSLLQASDADFFEAYGFAVTVSLDGPAAQHNLLRPFKGGKDSYEHIIERIAPLLQQQKAMQVSARVTVTPFNLNLAQTLDLFIGMGFHSVGFSPLLHAANGRAEMTADDLTEMLEGMIACGLAFEQHVLQGKRYPFLNMQNALRELHKGSHRPYPCGAGAGYFGVSADGELAACHRFVGDEHANMGNLQRGVDKARQTIWLSQRHVHQQQPCQTCWARYLCSGSCHHEVLARGRHACDYIRGWLHYTLGAHQRLSLHAPEWFADHDADYASPKQG